MINNNLLEAQLKQVANNIWVKEQPFKYLGLEVGTRTTIVRLSNNNLVLISPIKINEEAIKKINSLGIVKYIIAPNLFHHLFVLDCQKKYPEAKIITAPGLTEKVPEIKSDYILTKDKINFNDDIEYFLFAGFQVTMPFKFIPANEIVFYHLKSKTLILTDSAFYFDRSFPLITQFAGRILGCYEQLRPSILDKIATKDKEQMTSSVKKLLQWDFNRVIMAHGTIIEENAKEKLLKGYEWFLNINLTSAIK